MASRPAIGSVWFAATTLRQLHRLDVGGAERGREPWQCRVECLGGERPVVFARLGHHRAADPVGAGDRAQRVGRGVLALRVGRRGTAEGGVGRLRDVVGTGRRGDVEPSRQPV